MGIRFIIFFVSLFLFLSGCETIKKKSDEVAEKENEKYGQFIGKQIDELMIEFGNSTDDYVNEKGNKIFIYKTKKYGIICERKFEIDSNKTIIGFTSSGCI